MGVENGSTVYYMFDSHFDFLASDASAEPRTVATLLGDYDSAQGSMTFVRRKHDANVSSESG